MERGEVVQRGVSQAFVKEVNARMQALHEYSDQLGLALPPDLLDGVQQLNKHYGGKSPADQSAFSPNVSSVSDKSGVSKSPAIPFDLKDFSEDGSVVRTHDASLEGRFPPAEDEDSLSLSYSSSVYSTASKKKEARKTFNARKQELKDIRQVSKSVRNQVYTRVRDLRVEASQVAENEGRVSSELTFYHSELERMKEAVGKLLLETSKTKSGIERARDSVLGSEHSAVLSSRRNRFDSYGPEHDSIAHPGSFVVGEQLKEMQRELSDLHSRIRNSEVDMREKEMENKELKVQVGKLENSLVAMGTIPPSDKVEIEKEGKTEACSDHCITF